jgi:GTP cyclohydrolase II
MMLTPEASGLPGAQGVTMKPLRVASRVPVDELQVLVSARLPSRFGTFTVHGFRDADEKEQLAIVRGEIRGREDVLTRIHSECLTGDVLGSLRCDCREQLERALARIGTAPMGVVLYLRQEGNKLRAYALQERGLDTIDANLALGFAADQRDYRVAAMMLRALGVSSIQLLTNNPDKVRQLTDAGVRVSSRIPHAVASCEHNRGYLETKRLRAGHWLDAEPLRVDSAA